MQTRSSILPVAGLVALLAAAILAGDRAAYAVSQPVILPTGATITPDAAPGSVFQPLTVALPYYPNYTPDDAESTAVSPDGKTLLILTSGYNLNLDVNGNYQHLTRSPPAPMPTAHGSSSLKTIRRTAPIT